MKLLMISDPSSIHTSNWLDGLISNGLEVEIIFPKEWIFGKDGCLESVRNHTKLLDIPSFSYLSGDSIRKFAIFDLTRDIWNRTRIHQSLRYAGKLVREYAIERNFDFIHAQGMATSALLANASKFRPYSASSWGSDIYLMPDKYSYLKKLIARTAVEAAFLHAQSQISAERLRSLSPDLTNKIFISTWGVDTDKYRPDVPPRKIAEIFNLDKKRYILSFRSLESIYRIDYIIKAFAIVAEQEQDLLLVIAGDGSLKSDLMHLSKELELDSRIIFTGFVDSNTKMELFSNALLYIQCPKSDGVSLSMMEAMSSGQPLISSNVGETSILIESGTNGFLIDDVTPENLAKTILKISSDRKLRDRISDTSRVIAMDKHDRNVFFKSFIEKVRKEVSSEN